MRKLTLLFILTMVGCALAAPTSGSDPASTGQQPIETLASILPTQIPPTVPPPTFTAPPESEREVITLTISLYRLIVLREDGTSDPRLSSARTDEGLHEILTGMNVIWNQASIQYEARYVGPLTVPADVAIGLARGDLGPFYAHLDSAFALMGDAMINGIYARNVGGPNGFTPGSRLYFVTDTPSVFDHRVSSHEVGHILGLGHVLSDPDHLLSPGTNGMLVEDREIAVARQTAASIVEAVSVE